MPAYNYAPIPLDDETFSPSYNTGIPSTAPPSFRSVPLSIHPSSLLPHRNDESAATIMPRESRQPHTTPQSLLGEDPAVSIWAPSESNFDMSRDMDRDLEAAREDAIAKLIERVEALERRAERSGEGELSAGTEKALNGSEWSRREYCGVVAVVLVVVWVCGTVTLAVAARYRAAGNKE